MRFFRQVPIAAIGTDSEGDALSVDDLKRIARSINESIVYYCFEHDLIVPPMGRWQNALVKKIKEQTVLLADLYHYELGEFRYLSDVGMRPVRPPARGETELKELPTHCQILHNPSDPESALLARVILNSRPKALEFSERRYYRKSKLRRPVFILTIAPNEEAEPQQILYQAADILCNRLERSLPTTVTKWLLNNSNQEENKTFVVRVWLPRFQVDACITSENNLDVREAFERLRNLLEGVCTIVPPERSEDLTKASFLWNQQRYGWSTNYLVFADDIVATDQRVEIKEPLIQKDGIVRLSIDMALP